jgi:hypothetical protein
VNYGTGRLDAEPGLYADVSVIASYAAALTLSLAPSLGEDSPLVKSFQDPLTRGQTYIVMALAPNVLFFPEMFAGVKAQHAFQSAWWRVSRRADCPTCGEDPAPLTELKIASVDQLRAAAADLPSA